MQGSVGPNTRAFKHVWPEAQIQNIVDDSLSTDVHSTGLSASMDRRFESLAAYAKSVAGVHGILFTCSAFGSCIEKVQAAHSSDSFPILKPNETMMATACRRGGRVGVLSVFGDSASLSVHALYFS